MNGPALAERIHKSTTLAAIVDVQAALTTILPSTSNRGEPSASRSHQLSSPALAIFELFSGRHEEARRRLRRALNLNPNSEFARGYLGVSYAFGGDYEAALKQLDEAIRLSPRGLLVVIWHLCKGWAALLAERGGRVHRTRL